MPITKNIVVRALTRDPTIVLDDYQIALPYITALLRLTELQENDEVTYYSLLRVTADLCRTAIKGDRDSGVTAVEDEARMLRLHSIIKASDEKRHLVFRHRSGELERTQMQQTLYGDALRIFIAQSQSITYAQLLRLNPWVLLRSLAESIR